MNVENESVSSIAVVRPVRRGGLGRLGRIIRAQPLGVAAAAIIIIFVVIAVAAPLVAPDDPLATDALAVRHGPTSSHIMGTDQFGRDTFSRIVYGTRVSLLVGVLPVALATVVGTALGLLSGFAGGWVDELLQRFVDALMAFPALILAMVIVSALGTDFRNVVIAIAVIMVPLLTRVARGSVLATRNLPYVEAARTLGAGEMRVALRHILPNIVSPTIIVASSLGGSAVLAEASLSFLGFGIQPPNPSWGNMLTDARTFLAVAPWMAIFPGIAIAILVLAFNLLGDSLNDVSDPRSNKGRAL